MIRFSEHWVKKKNRYVYLFMTICLLLSIAYKVLKFRVNLIFCNKLLLKFLLSQNICNHYFFFIYYYSKFLYFILFDIIEKYCLPPPQGHRLGRLFPPMTIFDHKVYLYGFAARLVRFNTTYEAKSYI